MSKRLGATLALLLTTAAFSFSSAANATPVTYDFSVQVTTGGLLGSIANGSFSYDDSSVVFGGTNKAPTLLTALDFTFNGISYGAASANTGLLSFDTAGALTGFWFGNSCVAGTCSLITHGDSWSIQNSAFAYTALVRGRSVAPGQGTVSYSLVPAAPIPVPEPGTLGLFAFGAVMLALFAGTRRRRR